MNEILETRLRTLEGNGLIRQAARVPEPEYTFRHVLSLDAAYESMLRQDRRHLHLVVGECLEMAFTESVEEYAPILARHFEEAGDDTRALNYLSRAAESASRRYASREAILLLDRARAVALRGLAAGPVISDLCVRAGRLHEMSGDYDAALRTYDQLETLASERGDGRMTIQAILARAAVFCAPTTRYDAVHGLAVAEKALSLASASGDRVAECKAQWLILLVSKFSGQPERGTQAGYAAVAIARELGLHEQLAYALNDMFLVHLMSGRAVLGIEALREAEQLWRALGNLPLLADTLTNLGYLLLWEHGPTAAEAALTEAEKISDAIGNVWGQSYSKSVRSMALLGAARYDEAIRLAETSIALGKLAGFAISQIAAPCVIGFALADLGLPAQGEAISRAALAAAEQSVPYFRGWPATTIALCVIQSNDRGAVEEAISVARELATPHDISMLWLGLMEIEFARLLGQPELVLEKVDAAETEFKAFIGRAYLPAIWARRAEAQLILGRVGEAEATINAAAALMKEQGTRRAAWQLHTLQAHIAEACGKHAEAARAIELARQEIDFVAEHAGSDDARQAFLHLPEVMQIRGVI